MVYTNSNKKRLSRISRISRSMRNRKTKSKSKSKSNQMKNKTMKNRSFKGGYKKDKDTHNEHNIKPHMGGASCSNEGVGTGNPKSETFKTYLNNLNTKLDMPLKGGSSCGSSSASDNKILQRAGGYTTDPSEFIAGMPVHKGYDDCCPPALINGSLQSGGPNTSVCGYGAMRGGRKNKQNRKYNLSKTKTHKYKHTGGGDYVSNKHSNPANYSTAFNGPPGVFSYPVDISKRTFGELQPDYTPNAL